MPQPCAPNGWNILYFWVLGCRYWFIKGLQGVWWQLKHYFTKYLPDWKNFLQKLATFGHKGDIFMMTWFFLAEVSFATKFLRNIVVIIILYWKNETMRVSYFCNHFGPFLPIFTPYCLPPVTICAQWAHFGN